MIQKQVKTDDFTLEFKLTFKDTDKKDFAYENGIGIVAEAFAGAIYSGELYPLFLSEFRKVVEKMMVAIQTEQALKGED